MRREDELYLFDLNGYLVIEDAIEPDLLAEVNAIADDYETRARLGEPEGEGEPSTGVRHTIRYSRIIKEHEMFRRAIFSPKVLSRINDFVIYPRLKSTWLDFKMRGGGIHYHSNHTPFNPIDAYVFHHRIVASLVTVCFALADVPEDGAALDVIPGSHKANFELPEDPAVLDSLRRKLPLKAGSALIFSHDINHGSTNSRDYVRRTLFSSYSTGSSAHSQGEDNLYDDLFDASPEGSWQKYLLRRPLGNKDSYPQPDHSIEEEFDFERV